MRTLRYNLVDVFTDRALEGNQLAVFTASQGLSAEQMQSIAREMNLSETVFFFPPTEGGHARLRIFTPRTELPFAGHPVLGSAWVLGGPMEMDILKLETGAGVIEVRLTREGGKLSAAWMRQPLPKLSEFKDLRSLSQALRPENGAAGITSALHADNGPRHLLCDVGNVETLTQLKPDLGKLAALFAGGVLTYAWAEDGHVRARYFAPAAGINEDAATGSAAGPLGAHLVLSGRHTPGQILVVEQGIEMSRPSRLLVRVEIKVGELSVVHVGGSARVIGRGELSPF
jgi:trans-2,3-dihydro-3-hydroxyanthranilate isomerase